MAKPDLSETFCTDVVTAIINLLELLCKEVYFGDKGFNLKQKIERLQEIRLTSTFGHPMIPGLLYEVGDMLYHQKQYNYALAFFLEHLRIQKMILGRFHPDLSDVLERIGRSYQSQGSFDLAIRYYEEAKQLLSMQIKKFSRYGSIIMKIKYNVGIVLIHAGCYDQALELLQLVLSVKKDALGENHPEIASMYYDIGVAQLETGNTQDAMLSTLESLRIRKLIFGNNHELVEESLCQLGRIYEKDWKYEEAMTIYNDVLQIKKYRVGCNHPSLITTLNNIGRVHRMEGEIDEAISVFRGALSIAMDSCTDEYEYAAKILNEIANINAEIGRTEEAMQAFTERARIMESLGLSGFVIKDQENNTAGTSLCLALKETAAAAA